MIDLAMWADEQTDIIVDVMGRVQDAHGRWVERPTPKKLEGYIIRDEPPGAVATLDTGGMRTGAPFVGMLVGPMAPELTVGTTFTDVSDGERYMIEDRERWPLADLIMCSLSTPKMSVEGPDSDAV